MKKNSVRQHEVAFTILRTSLSHLNLPMDLVDELIERHIPVAFEKGELALCEGNADGVLACNRCSAHTTPVVERAFRSDRPSCTTDLRGHTERQLR